MKKRRLTIVSSAASRVAVETNAPVRRRPVDPERARERRDEDVLVGAREEMREDAVGERGDPDRHVVEGGAEPERRVGRRARSGSASAGSCAPASSGRCRCTTIASASSRTALVGRPLEPRLRGGEPEQRPRRARSRRRQRRSTRGRGSGSPIACRDRRAAAVEQRERDERTTTTSAISAPERRQQRQRPSVPAAGRTGARAARALAAGRRVRPAAASVGSSPCAALRASAGGCTWRRRSRDRARSPARSSRSRQQELGAVVLLVPCGGSRVPGGDG